MKLFWTICSLLIGNYLNAQNIQSDLELLRAHQISSSIPAKGEKSGLAELYRNHVSGQWGHSCYFEIPCADFSSQLMQQYGVVKGFFLAVDRYGKCNKLSFYETLPSRINAKGKIIDSVRFYSSR